MKVLSYLKIFAFIIISTAIFTSKLTALENSESKEVKFKTNLHCESCKAKIEKKLKKQDGVLKTDINLENKIVSVTYNPAKTDEASISKSIAALGYTVNTEDGVSTIGHKKECMDKKDCSDKKDCKSKKGCCDKAAKPSKTEDK